MSSSHALSNGCALSRSNTSSNHAGISSGSGAQRHLTTGTGTRTKHVLQLAGLLDQDSESMHNLLATNSTAPSRLKYAVMTNDRFVPSAQLGSDGVQHPDLQSYNNEHNALVRYFHELLYDKNRGSLVRAIGQTIQVLKQLQEMNIRWPMVYSTLGGSATPSPSHVRRLLGYTQPSPAASEASSLSHDLALPGRTVGQTQQQLPPPSASQAYHEFSVLKLDLKMGGLSHSDIVHSLERQSVAALLDTQISNSIRHLMKLAERVEDKSSKILVTGDLNAGKSTFCNALLRRKVLPEDEQPCTAIFCEVLDSCKNTGIEEVHAVPHGVAYDHDDERTYRTFSLQDLDQIAADNDVWSQCKLFVGAVNSQSLLNNGVVDIALIDAPGLNNDSFKTTGIFARQEEIDVVVFVVSATNHFTISAKDFIINAAHEKAYIFIVVNAFDKIRDKEKCQRTILQQIAQLSPGTSKEASELVHFVSSNAIPCSAQSGDDSTDHCDCTSESFGSQISFPDPQAGGEPLSVEGYSDEPSRSNWSSPHVTDCLGKEQQVIEDFEDLESSLRRFVLEKRARSKLAPAKTYLLNLLTDVNSLTKSNRDLAQDELEKATQELEALDPWYEESQKARLDVDDKTEKIIEQTTLDIYRSTRTTLDAAITDDGGRHLDLNLHYEGLLNIHQYADDIKEAMLASLSTTLHECEEEARRQTVQGINTIKTLGLLHLGDNYVDLKFRPDMMFKTRNDALARRIDLDLGFWDFVNPSSVFHLPFSFAQQDKMASTSVVMTVAGVIGGRLFGSAGWADHFLRTAKILGSNNIRSLIVPGLVLAGDYLPTYSI